MQTLAITGASGFLGRHLVSECIAQGRFNLRLLTRNPDAFKHFPNNKVIVCEGDLLAPDKLKDFLQPGCTLIHLAYMGGNAWDANIEAAFNLVRAAKRSGVKRVVHCSTAVVIGPRAKGVVTEDTKPFPRGQYQQVKFQIEEIMRAELLPEIELAILRPTEIIGPGGQGLRSMIRRLQDGRSGKNFICHAVLKNRGFNYVSVHNVVAALMLLASLPVMQAAEVYNISDDDDPDNNYAVVEKVINDHLNLKHGYVFDAGFSRPLLSLLFKLLRDRAPLDRVYSASKISSAGYRKVMPLRQAIAEVVSWEVNNGRS